MSFISSNQHSSKYYLYVIFSGIILSDYLYHIINEGADARYYFLDFALIYAFSLILCPRPAVSTIYSLFLGVCFTIIYLPLVIYQWPERIEHAVLVSQIVGYIFLGSLLLYLLIFKYFRDEPLSVQNCFTLEQINKLSTRQNLRFFSKIKSRDFVCSGANILKLCRCYSRWLWLGFVLFVILWYGVVLGVLNNPQHKQNRDYQRITSGLDADNNKHHEYQQAVHALLRYLEYIQRDKSYKSMRYHDILQALGITKLNHNQQRYLKNPLFYQYLNCETQRNWRPLCFTLNTADNPSVNGILLFAEMDEQGQYIQNLHIIRRSITPYILSYVEGVVDTLKIGTKKIE